MACFVNGMAFLVMAVGIFVSGQIKIEKDDNIEPFSLLCRIYNVAKNPPINYVDLQEPFKILEEINSLNTSLVEPKLPNETEQMRNSVGAQLNTTTREAAFAQLSLNQITQRAHKILEEIEKIKVTENIEKAKAEFHKVIFGEDGNESDLERSTLNGVKGRAEACGDTGLSSKGSSAGKNLVVDFFCLCAQRPDGDGVNQVCGFYVGSGYKNGLLGWNETDPMGSSTMWASIKGGCGKHMHQHPKSTAEAHHILDQFLKHLQTGGVYRWGSGNEVKGSKRKEGMLGTGVGEENSADKGSLCNGKNGKGGNTPGGVCVYYGKEAELDNIPWLQKFKTALNTVDATNSQIAAIQRSLQKLQMLLHRAEEIYETAKVITEIQKPERLTALQNVSGNLTVHNTTRTRSYSYGRHAYFAIPWVLFL